MASDAFSEPVTGSSPVPLMSGVKARTSNATGDPGGYGPKTPISRDVTPGASASTASALASSTATQPGPLSAHWASTMSSRSMPSDTAISASSGSPTGPERISGGALKASRPSGQRRTGTSPTPHS